jgi:formylmethanofuran dehydrogenase subunit E
MKEEIFIEGPRVASLYDVLFRLTHAEEDIKQTLKEYEEDFLEINTEYKPSETNQNIIKKLEINLVGLNAVLDELSFDLVECLLRHEVNIEDFPVCEMCGDGLYNKDASDPNEYDCPACTPKLREKAHRFMRKMLKNHRNLGLLKESTK